MADSKLTALTAETTVAMTDITYFVDDPSGTPLSRKCTIANLSKGIDMTNVPSASGAITLQPAAGNSLNVTLSSTGDFLVNTNLFVIDTSVDNVGVGTSAPLSKLEVVGTDIVANATIATAPGVIRARTLDQELAVGCAYDGGNRHAWFQARHPTINAAYYNIAFQPLGGKVGIGGKDADDKLHIKVGTTDAVECLKLEQLDVSEGFANFVSTSDANTTNPITTWTTGAAIAGFVRIEINGTDQWIPFYSAPTS